MLRRILAGLALLAALLAWAGGRATAQGAGDDAQLVRRIERWLQHWQHGKVELDEPVRSTAVAARLYGDDLISLRATPPPRHVDGIARLIDAASRRASPELTRALLELAAVGIADGRVGHASHTLRALANRALLRARDPAVIATLLAATEASERELGIRIAAARALSGVRTGVARVYLHRRLDDPESLLRLAAAESLGLRADPLSLPALRDRLTVERDPVVLQALARALRQILGERERSAPASEWTRTAMAAIDALGRGDWRADLALVELLTLARTARTIAPLIELLARTAEQAAETARLRDAAHDLLQSLTGTRIPLDDVAGWRAFWTRVRDDFVLAKVPQRRPEAGATTSGGFFGIPVRGGRIEFIIDLSGSMGGRLAPIPAGTTARPAGPATRLEWAIHELNTAVDALPDDARFRVVLFANRVSTWPDVRVAPTRSVKRSLDKMLDKLQPGGGTNLFAGLDRALGISESTYGEVVPDGADEIFVLTDGFPSVGEITATDEIIRAVEQANRYQRTRIHTISLGGNVAFLRQLAEQNGGTFVERR